MNFVIERVVEHGFSLIRLKDNNTNTYVTIMPAAGGLIHEFVVQLDGSAINIIDNYKTPEELQGFLALSYKGCKLSPFACRIADGKWSFNETNLEFKSRFKDGSAIHGLLYNKVFNVADEFTDEGMASVSLRYHYKGEDDGYPFDYVCEIRYILQAGNLLQLETTVTNLDDYAIPLIDGWHPYFNLGGKIDDYILQFSASSMLEFDATLVPTGNIVAEGLYQDPQILGDRYIDNCYILNNEPGLPCCVLHNPLNNLTVTLFASDAYPYLQIFTPMHRNSIAIENLSGAPDGFNNGIGLLTILPRRSKTFNAWYRVDAVKSGING